LDDRQECLFRLHSLINQDAIDLYQRLLIGSKVVVLAWRMGFRMSVFINKDSRDG